MILSKITFPQIVEHNRIYLIIRTDSFLWSFSGFMTGLHGYRSGLGVKPHRTSPCQAIPYFVQKSPHCTIPIPLQYTYIILQNVGAFLFEDFYILRGGSLE